jgi:hypothetical protein
VRDVIRFRSELFVVEPGEDEQTNPLCFGKAFAHWLRDRFAERGYPDAAVVPEDFGWCVMLEREPFLLWVGCASELDDEDADPEGPEDADVADAAAGPGRVDAVAGRGDLALLRGRRDPGLDLGVLEAAGRPGRPARACGAAGGRARRGARRRARDPARGRRVARRSVAG